MDVGSSVGRYVLLRPAGGRRKAPLFVAFDPELDRNVVLKLMSLGRGDPEFERERLLHEAQALARLQHPNIVVIYDVGTWEERVYISMEYIDGESLKDWIEASSPAWSEIRDVIIQAGEGLAAAHAAEIVHLDVQPSNIIVATDGIVRVVEFGLARRLRPSMSIDTGTSDSGRTAPVAVTGAPAYVAAECYRGDDVDARADQFALCVTAWEALYGVRPFAGDNPRDVRSSILRGRITDPPPSNVPAWVEAVLRRRGLDPNPHKRWPDLGAFMRALDRRAGRGRLITIGAATAGAVAAGGAFGRTSRRRGPGSSCAVAARTSSPRSGTRRPRRKSRGLSTRRGVDYADATWRGLETILDVYAGEWVTMYTDACEATRLRGEQSEGLLDRRMSCLEERRRELEALVGVLVDADVAVAERTVVAATSLTPIDPCADVERLMARTAPMDPDSRAKYDALRQQLAEARAFDHAGRIAATEALAREALATAVELGAPAEEAAAHLLLSTVTEARGRGEDAVREVQAAAWAADRAGADEVRLSAYTQLAWTIGHFKANRQAGHQAVRVGLALAERLGNDPMARARLLAAESVLFFDEGKYRTAIDLGHEVNALIAETGEEQPELGANYNNLAAAHQLLGELDEALRYFELAREARVRLLGKAHPEVAQVVANIASVKQSQGRLDEAHRDFEAALAILEARPAAEAVRMPSLFNNYAALLQERGRYDEARAYFQKSIDMWRTADPKQPLIGVGLCNIADLELQRGDPQRAQQLAGEALRLLEAGLGKDHRHVGFAASTLGRAELALDNAKAAQPLLRRAVKSLTEGKADADAVAEAQLGLAKAIVAGEGNAAEASALAAAAELRYRGARRRRRGEGGGGPAHSLARLTSLAGTLPLGWVSDGSRITVTSCGCASGCASLSSNRFSLSEAKPWGTAIFAPITHSHIVFIGTWAQIVSRVSCSRRDDSVIASLSAMEASITAATVSRGQMLHERLHGDGPDDVRPRDQLLLHRGGEDELGERLDPLDVVGVAGHRPVAGVDDEAPQGRGRQEAHAVVWFEELEDRRRIGLALVQGDLEVLARRRGGLLEADLRPDSHGFLEDVSAPSRVLGERLHDRRGGKTPS